METPFSHLDVSGRDVQGYMNSTLRLYLDRGGYGMFFQAIKNKNIIAILDGKLA